MLSSKSIRTLTLLLIGLASVHILGYTMGVFHYQVPVKVARRTSDGENFEEQPSNPWQSTPVDLGHKTLNCPNLQAVRSETNNTAQSTISYNESEVMTQMNDMESDTTINEELFTMNISEVESGFNAATELCPEIPPGLGPYVGTPKLFDELKGNISLGGYYEYKKCVPRRRVAIIVPVRYIKDHKDHITFLQHLHQFLMTQQMEYQIFLIGQNNTKQEYKRGRLINVAFLEILHRYPHFLCFIIHMPNIIPIDTRNLYQCNWYPRQLVVSINTNHMNYVLPNFGEAVALTRDQIETVNGFSNHIGEEDNKDFEELRSRLIECEYVVETSPLLYGRYAYIYTIKVVKRPETTTRRQSKVDGVFPDGLLSVAYNNLIVEARRYYTYFSVSFPEDIKFMTKA